MSYTSEDAVTDILTKSEILKREDSPEVFETSSKYSTNPNYDLSSYLNAKNPEPSRFGAKYIFVK